MPSTTKDNLEVVKQGGAGNADTLGAWQHFTRPIHTSKFSFSGDSSFARSSISSAGVHAGEFWRRLAASPRFKHRHGAQTRSPRRLLRVEERRSWQSAAHCVHFSAYPRLNLTAPPMKLPRFSCRLPDNSPSPLLQNLQSDSHPSLTEVPLTTGLNSTPALVSADGNRPVVLLVEPDAEIRSLLRFGLEKDLLTVLEAANGNEAIEMAHLHRPAAVLLDLDVAEAGALSVLQRLREWSRIPILALSGRSNTIGAVQALDRGATDFITRPFKMDELLARLRAARRFAPPPAPEIFRSGSLTVDLASRTVIVAEREVKLSETEFSLLRLFVLHAGNVLTHAQILSEVWGAEMLNKVEYLRVYLMALRKKLANPPEPDLFRTERSVGYCLALRSP